MVNDFVIQEHNSKEEFEGLKEEWNELLIRSRCNSVFLTWDWLYVWWCHMGKGACTLKIITVRTTGGELIGIGPFCILKKGWIPVKELTFLGTTGISSDYLDIIADSEYEKEVISVIIEALFNQKKDWDLISFPSLLDSSYIFIHIKDLMKDLNVFLEQIPWQPCPYLSLPDSNENFLKMLGSETRASLKRRTKKMKQMGAEIDILQSAEDLPSRFNTLFSLHGKRWALRGLKGNLAKESIRNFHLDLAKRFIERGWLKLYSLKIEQNIIACLYAFEYNNKLFYYQAGFEPEWGAHSPGFVLMGQCIEDAIANGLSEFDYLRGDEPYKRRWTKTSRQTWRLNIIPAENLKSILNFRFENAVKVSKRYIKTMISPFLLLEKK